MIRVRQVDDVAIVDWSHKDVATVVPRIRALVDANQAKRLLLNMREVETLKGEGLETLTEALSVCEDKGCTLGMFGLNTYLTQLVDIMGLHEVMPTIVGTEESEALTRVRTLEPGAPRDEVLAAEEIEFDPVDSGAASEGPARAAADGAEDVEFEFEEPTSRPGGRPPSKKSPLATVKFERGAKPTPNEQTDEDLLGVAWGDLVAQGLAIGGPAAADIVARVKSEATAPTRSLGPTKDTATRATKVPEELEPIEHKTAIIPAFSIGSEVRNAADQLEQSEEEENLEVDFEPSASSGERPVRPLFGTADPEPSGWSPVDESSARPTKRSPSARLPQPATPPTPRPATPQPATARPAQRPAAAPPAAAARTSPPTQPPATGGMDQGDETVMFQPDGLLAEVLAAVAPTEPAPPATPSRATSRPEAAPAMVTRGGGAAPPVRSDNGVEELKKFLGDYAMVSELHLRVLDKFSREGVEKVLGRPEVQSAVGGSAAAISSILEDFVQARLIRRRRSPRIRGGTGFLYSPSPRTRNAVIRLLRRYEDGTTRAEVMSWVSAVRKANER